MIEDLSDVSLDGLLPALSRFTETLKTVQFHVGDIAPEQLQKAERIIREQCNEILPHTTVELFELTFPKL